MMETKPKRNEEIKLPEITVKTDGSIEDVSYREEVKAKIEFLNEQIGKRISTFDSLRAQNRRGALALRILSSMLGTVITILLGLKLDEGFKTFETIAVNIALVLGSVITIVNSWEVFWDPKPLWIRYTVASTDLRSLWSDLDYLTKKGTDKITVEEINNLYDRYKTILNEANKAWQQLRSEEERKAEARG